MPIACDPNATWTYVLKNDRGLPAERQARFTLRFLTRRQKKEYLDGVGTAGDAELRKAGGEEVITRLYARLAVGVAGWTNLHGRDGADVPFDAARISVLDDILTDRELWELYLAAGYEIDEEDRKNSDGRPNASPEGSAAQGPAPAA